MLADREDAYWSERKRVKPRPAQYKDLYPYLKEVDSLALANVQLNLEAAYKRYFTIKGTGHPKFKSRKKAKKSYTTNAQKSGKGFTVEVLPNAGAIKLPKAGLIPAKLHRLPGESWRVKSATVSMDRCGDFWCSVLFEYDTAVPVIDRPELNAVGLDYKSDGLYVSSDGHAPGSPKFFRKSQKALTRAQRKLRHKQKGSRNYNKSNRRIAKVHRHIANQRKDFLHKESTATTKQYDLVCIEDLDMKALSNRSFRNGKATMDNGWGMFRIMLAYKLARKGDRLIKVSKWFPSSQLCHICGHKEPSVKDLSVREWLCPCCGAVHDRDLNAAINIRSEGVRLFLQEKHQAS